MFLIGLVGKYRVSSPLSAATETPLLVRAPLFSTRTPIAYVSGSILAVARNPLGGNGGNGSPEYPPKKVLFLNQTTRTLAANSAGHLRKPLENDLLNAPEIPPRSIPVHLTSLEHRGGPCETPSLPLP